LFTRCHIASALALRLESAQASNCPLSEKLTSLTDPKL
jgi:hypothetical protein